VTTSERKRLIFIAGAEGSGTTLLLRILSAPNDSASLGGNYLKLPNHPDARRLVEAFDGANKRLWDRTLSISEHEQAHEDWREATRRIVGSDAFSNQARLVFKRSFPFASPRGPDTPDHRHTPDLWDTLDLMPRSQIVTIYRNPCAASYSALRRGFDSDLRRLAVVCAEQLTWLAGQVRAIDRERVHRVSYRRLCEEPERVLGPLAEFCGLSADALDGAASSEGLDAAADARYRRELDRSDADWLERFFDHRRRAQWSILDPDRASESHADLPL
jgi:hypothetical protein